MRLYRCPWCGEEVIDSVRKIWSGPVLSHCPNCHHDLEVRKLPTDLNIIYFFMVAWFLLLTWVSAFILPVFCIIFLFCIFAVISFFGTYILILTRDRNAKSYVSFSATLKFLPHKSGGYSKKSSGSGTVASWEPGLKPRTASLSRRRWRHCSTTFLLTESWPSASAVLCFTTKFPRTFCVRECGLL